MTVEIKVPVLPESVAVSAISPDPADWTVKVPAEDRVKFVLAQVFLIPADDVAINILPWLLI